jgi:cytochrome c-type biogenesis protein CcmH
MIRICALMFGVALSMVLPAPVWAVQPDEIMEDPALEARARDVSSELRCVVCRNESIDESNAQVARDLRLFVRELILEGNSNEEVLAEVVDRYGEYVLMRPPMTGSTIALWAAGPVLLLIGMGLAFGYLRRRATAQPIVEDALSSEEEARLRDLLGP